MGFLSLVVAYGMRACLSMAIVEMVDQVNRAETNNSVCSMAYNGFEEAIVQVNKKSSQFNFPSIELVFR